MTERGKLIPTIEATKRLGVDPGTLRKRVRAGEVAVFRDPLDARLRLLRLADVERLRRARPVKATVAAEGSLAR